jgi:hypothetical protein
MDEFLKVKNFKNASHALKNWMMVQFSVDIDHIEGVDASYLLYDTMKSVKQEFKGSGMELTDMNNIALNKMQDQYVKMLNLKKNTSARDNVLYTDRKPSEVNPLPMVQQNGGNDINKQFETILASRNNINYGDQPQPNQMADSQKEVAIPTETFDKMMNIARNDFLSQSIETLQQAPDDPKSFYEQPIAMGSNENDIVHTLNELSTVEPSLNNSTYIIEKEDSTNKPPTYRYVIINGCDRNWAIYKSRFSFAINLKILPNKIRNMASIEFTTLIIPCDIPSSKSQPAFLLQQEYRFGYPYLMLQIDEMPDLYDTLNENTPKSFIPFIYHKSYKCPNGRGYLVLKPAQPSVKVFSQPVDGPSTLSFSINKPTGALYNTKKDDYVLFKVDYEVYNSLYLKINIDKFFDKNEFHIGDNVIIKNFIMYAPPSGSCVNPADFLNMQSFINRPTGHDIVESGTANDNGYFRSFYIQAPCTFDASLGKMLVESQQVIALREFNTLNTTISSNGLVINTSLQNIVYVTIGSL